MRQWTPTEDEICQTSHVALALAGVWGAKAVLAVPPWKGALVVLLFVVVKEWLFDIFIEIDTWQGSLEDSLFYLAGMVSALALYYVFRRMRNVEVP